MRQSSGTVDLIAGPFQPGGEKLDDGINRALIEVALCHVEFRRYRTISPIGPIVLRQWLRRYVTLA
jgi:hypothetical protein